MPFKRSTRDYDGESLYEYAVGALGPTDAHGGRNQAPDAQPGEGAGAWRTAGRDGGRATEAIEISQRHDYAESYSRFRKENEKFGRLRVIQDLKTKGVHGDIIDSAVRSAYDDVNEEQLAREFLQRKRMPSPRARNRPRVSFVR